MRRGSRPLTEVVLLQEQWMLENRRRNGTLIEVIWVLGCSEASGTCRTQLQGVLSLKLPSGPSGLRAANEPILQELT